jgi:hypothetical protein
MGGMSLPWLSAILYRWNWCVEGTGTDGKNKTQSAIYDLERKRLRGERDSAWHQHTLISPESKQRLIES